MPGCVGIESLQVMLDNQVTKLLNLVLKRAQFIFQFQIHIHCHQLSSTSEASVPLHDMGKPFSYVSGVFNILPVHS